MSKYKITFIVFFFTALFINVFGQSNKYFFEVQKTGDGQQAMIFIPGFACSGEVWNETIAKFENQYTCYSLTMAGFAGVKAQDDSSFNNWVTSIADFIKDNNIVKPIIIGHSMGGAMALAIASDYPDLLDKIIVVDALPCLSALMNPSFKSNPNNDCSPLVNQITTMSDQEFHQLQKMSIPQLLTDTTMQEKVVSWSLESDRKTLAEMFCDFSNIDLREKIQNIKSPSLILFESYFININTNIKDQYKNLKTANLQYANKGLHFIMYDDKEWYFTQINNFLATQ